jgi:hypothetical protein
MRPLLLILGGECLFKDVSTHALKEAQGAPGVPLRYPKKSMKKNSRCAL